MRDRDESDRRDPLWYRVLDRFGFPTLVGVTLLGALMWILKVDREDRLAERAAMYKVMDTHASALKELTEAGKLQAEAAGDLSIEIRNNLAEMRAKINSPDYCSKYSNRR